MGVMRTLTLNGVTDAGESSVPTTITATLKVADWLGDTSPYSQVVAVNGVTSRTKVDLQPTMDQVSMMYSQSVGFFTMNEGGVVRAFAVGNRPTEEFTFQITMTEVESDATRIKGNTVGFPNPQPDWDQADTTQADYIKNKPVIPVAVSDDGYTDITGLRQAVGMSAVKVGNIVTMNTTLQGDCTTTSTITLNDMGYPSKIVTDGVECTVSWEGFDE